MEIEKLNPLDTRDSSSEGIGRIGKIMVYILPKVGYDARQAEPVSDTATHPTEGHRKPGFYLEPNDWPTDVPRDDLGIDEIYDVLDSFDEVYELAMTGLSNTDISAPGSQPLS